MNHIEYWLDDTSDLNEPLWCVSLCKPDGDEIRCLSTHELEDDAKASAIFEGAERGIPVFYRDEDGSISEVFAD